MKSHDFNDFLFGEVGAFFENCWSGYKFLVLEGSVSLVKSKYDFATQILKFPDFGVRIWSIEDMLKHISLPPLRWDFEWVITSFEKRFGTIDEQKKQILVKVFASIIREGLFNKDDVPEIKSIIDLNESNLLINEDIADDFKYLIKSDTFKTRELINEYKSDWVIDAKESFGKSFENEKLLDNFRNSYFEYFSEEESKAMSPLYGLYNWEKKLIVLFLKNDWNEKTDIDFDKVCKYVDKSLNFIKTHLNIEKIITSKKHIEILWNEKSSLNLLKNTAL